MALSFFVPLWLRLIADAFRWPELPQETVL